MAIISVLLTDTFDQWRIKTNDLSVLVGDLTLLTTVATSDLVSAINELESNANDIVTDIGDLSSLTTTDKTSIVSAINELDAGAVKSVTGTGVDNTDPQNPVITIDKATIGLDQVDNTSDVDKPISTATQTALDLKVSKTSDTGSAQLPSGTTAERDGTPITGSIRFNSDLTEFEGYNGSVWGTIGSGGGGGLTWTIESAGLTVTADSGYFVNTTSSAITLTLPATPVLGDRFAAADYAGTWAENNVTFARNGNNIMGTAEDFIGNINFLGIEFVYADATRGWIIASTADGSGSGGSGANGILWITSAVDVNAAAGDGYIMDTSAGSLTVTLPAAPTSGDIVAFKDYAGTFDDFNLIIDNNGKPIEGVLETYTIDSRSWAGSLVFADETQGWVFITSTPLTTIQSKPLLHVQDQKDSGTAGGTSTTGYNDRDLNAVLTNEIQGASLSTNTITLPAGEYYIHASVPGYSSTTTDVFRAFVRDSADNILLNGQGTYINRTQHSQIFGRISLSATTTIKISSYHSVGVVNGLGVPSSVSGVVEVYTDLRIWKLDAEIEYPRVYQPVNQPVTGAYVTGGIFGGELVYNSTTTVDVSPFSCMSDDLTAELAKASTTNVDLGTPSINTIYHIWAVKYTGDTFGCEADTDINGAGLPGTVIAKRWLGFVRTNSSGNIVDFYHSRNTITFNKLSEQVITSSASTTFFLLDVSSLAPIARLLSISVGFAGGSGTSNVSNDGTNSIGNSLNNGSLADTVAGPGTSIYTDPSSTYVKTNASTPSYILRAVKLKR